MQVKITGITHKGEGVGRIGGKAVFIPLAIPGEVLEVELTEERSRFMRGSLIRLVESSSDRVNPECPHFPTCGGCHFQHIEYSRQLELKRQIVADNLKRIGKIDTGVLPVIPSPEEWRYRNKVTWHVRGCQVGYFMADSPALLPISTCKLISEALEETSNLLRKLTARGAGDLSAEVSIRESHLTGERQMTIIGPQDLPSGWEDLQAVCENAALMNNGQVKQLWGSAELPERLGRIDFTLSPGSFFQVNHSQAERIVEYLQGLWEPDSQRSLLDLYCGVGALGLNLAANSGQITGIEEYGPSLEDARHNAQRNQIINTQFFQGACEKVLPVLEGFFDTIVLDPPRAGCAPEVVAEAVKRQPETIAYISCHPGTLARDLGRFSQHGYHPTLVQPIDMFPQTYHVESVVLLSRTEGTPRAD